MPCQKNLKKVMIIGSGPIVIGQACEFDYSGVQACKALMKLGLEVVLVNSNPATIMTDPETATKIYIEPLKFDYVKKILELEKALRFDFHFRRSNCSQSFLRVGKKRSAF